MKIFIGTDTPEVSGNVAKRFGHASYYILHNTESNALTVINNSQHDEKHQLLYEVLTKGVQIFIVGNIGPHAFGILNKEGVKIFLARNMTAEAALTKYNNGELELLTEPTVKKSMHKH